MKKYLLLAGFLAINTLSAQMGINTTNPQTAFHVDGTKDNNASGIPTIAQQLNDFAVSSSGGLGIGTTVPNEKVELNSGISNTSGLKFSNLTAATPAAAIAQRLGVDSNGTVVTIPNRGVITPGLVSVVGSYNRTTRPSIDVNDLGYTGFPETLKSFTIPAGGKAVFINLMLGIDYSAFPSGGGHGYYEARLFIDNAPTDVYLTTQEKEETGSCASFTFSTVKSLSAGSHTLEVRMIRSKNNGTVSGVNMRMTQISLSFNASYINN